MANAGRREFLQTMSWICASAWPLGWITPAAAPAEILIIRHAEEDDHGVHLNAKGRKRAAALPQLFTSRYTKPAFLFASKDTEHSHRGVETVEPLSAALRLPIGDQFPAEHFQKLARAILGGSTYAGAHILICWHHGTIPDLAEALGVTSGVRKWKDAEYDHVWRLQFTAHGVALTDELQKLLPGDSTQKE